MPHRKHRRLREIVGTLSPRELALVGVPSAALLLGVFYVAFRLVDPAPPRKIVIATSTPGSGYERFARLYAERLGRDGVELEIRLSGGSLENLSRLRDPASGIQAAFTTTGAALPETSNPSRRSADSSTRRSSSSTAPRGPFSGSRS
jgi:hypothetical protein